MKKSRVNLNHNALMIEEMFWEIYLSAVFYKYETKMLFQKKKEW